MAWSPSPALSIAAVGKESITERAQLIRLLARWQRGSAGEAPHFLQFCDRTAYDPKVNWPVTCAVVVPCFNEECTIGPLVQAIRLHLPAVIVVDDGSSDRTALRATEAGARVVSHERNHGKGAALRIGLETARQQGFPFALTLDGDGQHRPDDIPAFLHCAGQTRAALVIGNRMCHPQAIPWLRRATNRWISRQISKRTGRSLPDTQCGFRLINLEACSALGLRTDHFEIESEMLLAFIEAGHRVEFVPIQVVGRSGHSHIRPLKDTWRWLKWWRGSRTQPDRAA